MFRGAGQEVSPCRSGMPESPLLFSPEVSACGSFLLRSQEVKKFQSQSVEGLRIGRTKSRPRRSPSGRRWKDRGPLLEFWTAQLLDPAFRRNKARMCMKTKEEVKKSSSRAGKKPLIRLATLATLPPRGRGGDDVLYKNRGNELRKSLKTKSSGYCKMQKRTQNELDSTAKTAH